MLLQIMYVRHSVGMDICASHDSSDPCIDGMSHLHSIVITCHYNVRDSTFIGVYTQVYRRMVLAAMAPARGFTCIENEHKIIKSC